MGGNGLGRMDEGREDGGVLLLQFLVGLLLGGFPGRVGLFNVRSCFVLCF